MNRLIHTTKSKCVGYKINPNIHIRFGGFSVFNFLKTAPQWLLSITFSLISARGKVMVSQPKVMFTIIIWDSVTNNYK